MQTEWSRFDSGHRQQFAFLTPGLWAPPMDKVDGAHLLPTCVVTQCHLLWGLRERSKNLPVVTEEMCDKSQPISEGKTFRRRWTVHRHRIGSEQQHTKMVPSPTMWRRRDQRGPVEDHCRIQPTLARIWYSAAVGPDIFLLPFSSMSSSRYFFHAPFHRCLHIHRRLPNLLPVSISVPRQCGCTHCCLRFGTYATYACYLL
jgi:hypothetical protein